MSDTIQTTRPPIERPDLRMNDANYRTYQRYAGKKLLKEGNGVVLPGGIVIDGRPWRGFKHSVQVESYVMNSPTDLLLDPDPRCTYCWRPREDPKHSTEGLVKTGRLRPVEYSEVNRDTDLAQWVYDYSGAGKNDEVVGLVACGDMALYEVAPRWAYEWYDAPVDQTFAALQGLQSGFEEAAEEMVRRNRGMQHHGSSISVDEKTIQTADQEKRNPIGPGVPFGDASKKG